MAVHPRKTKPGTVPQPALRSQAAVALDRLPFGKDIDGWPRQWMGFAKDVPPGEHLVQCFRPFLHHLIERQLSKRSEEHTSELQSPCNLVCRLLLEKKKRQHIAVSADVG